MARALHAAKDEGVTHVVFGDLFLADLLPRTSDRTRRYDAVPSGTPTPQSRPFLHPGAASPIGMAVALKGADLRLAGTIRRST